MKIYFAASISAGRDYESIYQRVVHILKQEGYTVLTEHVAHPDVLSLENGVSPKHVYQRDIRKLQEADILAAEVSNPSTGVGYEIAYAQLHKKPVVCFYLRGITMSKMVTGNDGPLFSVYEYGSIDELSAQLPKWIKSCFSEGAQQSI